MTSWTWVLIVAALGAAALDAAAVKEINDFRAKHERDYRRQFVTLAGLSSLKDGVNTAGSMTTSDVVLPASLPPVVGRFIVSRERVTFEPHDGVDVVLKSQRVRARVDLKTDEADGGPDELMLGHGVSMWVHMSGDRRTIRIRDENGEPARTFRGFHWFPIDANFRVVGRFVKDAAPETVRIPNQTGDEETYTTEGVVEFTLDGQKLALRPMTTKPGRLYFVFRDGTSGKETYETARFLYANLSPDGTVILDFNQAYNPPCSFNPYTTCPLPPPENRLKVRILAGEKKYADAAGSRTPR
ncbi:MAG TPA: DUF1684 domain-containing protein [Vicinamibacterales bacterium]|nr:DUF1684 domain-containing protein [Vicinamibacterales bacterium]